MNDVERYLDFKIRNSLSSNELVVFMVIKSRLIEDEGYLPMKQSEIAEVAGLARRTVVDIISKLVSKDVISTSIDTKESHGINKITILKDI